MSTGFVWDERYMWHQSGTFADYVPLEAMLEPEPAYESPASKRRFKNLMDVSGMSRHVTYLDARPATVEEVARLHTREYIDSIKARSDDIGGNAGDGTPFGHGSYEIALLATGGCIVLVDAVLDGTVQNGYALVRPPGHHAEANSGRGFCIFGNTALAAMHARAQRGIERVAIVDWDVHHGNGTEDAFYEEPNVLTISLHQEEHYPAGRGRVGDNGRGAGEGRNLNIPLPAGAGRAAYELAFEQVVVPALDRFAPELILVASGFDASCMDPLGRQNLTPSCYRRLTDVLMKAADKHCQGRLALLHEGGYSTLMVPYCGLAVVEQLTGRQSDVDIDAAVDGDPASRPLTADQREAVAAAAANVANI